MLRKLLTLVVAVLVPIVVLAGGKGDRWPDTGGGGGSSGGLASGGLSSLLVDDRNHNAYTTTQCANLFEGTASSAICTNDLTKRYVTRAITQVRWEVVLQQNTPGATAGCAATLVTSDGDIVTTTKPLLGTTAVAGHTLLDSIGDGYNETATVALTAGEFIQVRWNDVAAGGTGGVGGTCAGAATLNTMMYLYAN